MKLSNEFKVGIMAVIAIVVLILGYQYLKSGQFWEQGRYYTVYYNNVSGLGETDDIIFRGYKIGSVYSIELTEANDSNGMSIKVVINITEEIPIYQDSEARIVNSDLLGDKAIEIIHRNRDQIAKDGATLEGTVETSLSQQIENELLPVKKKIESLVSNIDSVITRIQGIFDVDLQGKINKNLVSIEAAIVNIRDITRSVEEIVAMQQGRIDTTMRNVQEISTTIRNNKEELDRTFKNLATITDSLSNVEFGRIFADVQKVTTRIDEVVNKVENGEGTLGELINDDELYDNLKKVSVSLNQLVKDIEENPGRYSPTLFRIGTK